MSTGWQRVSSMRVVELHRAGWLGVYDALVSAVTGRRRVTAPTMLVASVYVCNADDAVIAITGATLEVDRSAVE